MNGLTQWNVFGVCAMFVTPSETETRHMKKLYGELFDGHVVPFLELTCLTSPSLSKHEAGTHQFGAQNFQGPLRGFVQECGRVIGAGTCWLPIGMILRFVSPSQTFTPKDSRHQKLPSSRIRDRTASFVVTDLHLNQVTPSLVTSVVIGFYRTILTKRRETSSR